MKLPTGKENQIAKYALERHVKWEKRVNTCAPVRCCTVCGKPIIWTWRNNELWDAPMYACHKDKCQKVFQHKASWPDEQHVNRPAF